MKPTLLIVEDNHLDALFFSELSKRYDLVDEIIVKFCPLEAIDWLKNQKEYESLIVVTDLTMVGVDGLKLAEFIKSINNAIPVVLVSSYDNVEALVKKEKSEVVGVYQKGSPISEFKQLLLESINDLHCSAALAM